MSIIPILLAASLSYALNALAVSGRVARLPLDRPNERSLHENPVPRIGGLGIVTGIAAGLIACDGFSLLVGLSLALAALSLADDWRPLPVSLRLAGHLSASAAMCVGTLDAGPVLLAALIASTAWMINLYNFMDGSDGLAGGMAVFGFGTYAGVAWLANDAMLATACASVAAAALAFLRFNFHPARVFMGDVGSIPIGFLVAGLGLTGAHRGDWPLWFPAVVFAPFLVDASWTLLRRVANGEKVWQAHRNHYYQRLVRLGWGHRRTAVAEYGLMAISGVAAVAALFAPPMPRVAIFVALGLLYAGAMWAVDRRWSAFSGTDPR